MAWSAPSKQIAFVAVGFWWSFALLAHPASMRRGPGGNPSQKMVSQDANGNPVKAIHPHALPVLLSAVTTTGQKNGWPGVMACSRPNLIWSTADAGGLVVFTLDTSQHDVAEQLINLRAQLDLMMRAKPHRSVVANGHVVTNGAADGVEAWCSRVEAAQSTMADGSLRKVSLARSQAYSPGDTHAFDPLATAWALRIVSGTPPPFSFAGRWPLLGSSPETWFNSNKEKCRLSLSLERRRDATSAEDAALAAALLDSKKDRQEQSMWPKPLSKPWRPCRWTGPVRRSGSGSSSRCPAFANDHSWPSCKRRHHLRIVKQLHPRQRWVAYHENRLWPGWM